MEGILEQPMSETEIERILNALDRQDESRESMKLEVSSLTSTLTDCKGEIRSLVTALSEFKKQYDYDMRGDPKINGYKGLIGEVRELKEYMTKFPSFLKLLSDHPGKVVTTLASLFLGALTFIVIVVLLLNDPGIHAFACGLFKGIPGCP